MLIWRALFAHRVAKGGKLPKWAIKKAGGINKKAWSLFRRGRKAVTRRRTNSPRRRTNNTRSNRRMKTLPHPSITGLASGAIIVKYLNEGNKTGQTVSSELFKGNLETATRRFFNYAPGIVTTDKGKKAFISAIAIAVAGGLIRKAAPNVKLGGSKIFARI